MNSSLPDLIEIGRRIKEIRNYLDLTQEELGDECGCSNATISELEAGKGKPNFETLFNLSSKFNIDIDFVFHGTGSMVKCENNPVSISAFFPKEHASFVEKVVRHLEVSELMRFSFLDYFKRYFIKNKKLIEMEKEQEQGKQPVIKD